MRSVKIRISRSVTVLTRDEMITGTPTFFLISPDKKVISTWFGYEEGMIEDEIPKALEQQEE